MYDSLWLHGLQHTRLLCPPYLLELAQITSIETVMLSRHLTLCHSLLLLPSIFSQSMHMLYFNRCCLITLKNTGSFYENLCSYHLHFPIITMTLNAICLFILFIYFFLGGGVAFFSSLKKKKNFRGKILYNIVMIFVTH